MTTSRTPQTEACASITNYAGRSVGFLNSVYDDLRREGLAARTEAEYAGVRVEIDRVRGALAARLAL